MTATDHSDRELIVTRVFDAPRELVFDAFLDPQNIARWWGPRGFRNTIHEMDPRPGGVWRYTMHSADGTDYPNRIVYDEIVRPERIAYGHGDDKVFPMFHATISFETTAGGTKVTIYILCNSAEEREEFVKFGAVEGGQQNLERLSEHLAVSRGAFTITRTFDAPRELVFRAWTEREHLLNWWGPAGLTIDSMTADIRPGGTMHYNMRTPDGQEMWGKWAIRDVVPSERFVWVNSFSDPEGNVTRAPFAPQFPLEVLSVVTLEERDGKTTLTMQGVPINPSEAERKVFDDFNASMQMGWGATLDKLAAHLSTRS